MSTDSHPSADAGAKPVLAATMIALAAAFTLAGYEFLRSPVNTLYKASYGKAGLPMVMALIPLSVALCVYVYGRILSAAGPRRTLWITTLGSVGIMAGCQWAHDAGVKPAIWILYLFRSAYVVLIIEQYWSFLNSTFSAAQARKFNGPVCGVASVGSILAGIAGAGYVGTLGTANMVYAAGLATLPALFLADHAYRIAGEPVRDTSTQEGDKSHVGLGLFRSNRLLQIILVIVVATQVVAATTELSFQGVIQDLMPDPDTQTAFSYKVYAWINGIAAILQFLVAPLMMHWVNPAFVIMFIPFIHIATSGSYFLDPGLVTATLAYAGFKVIDYSVFRAAKEVLYIPMSFDARYRAKEVIDVFGYRFSKGITSGVITLIQTAGILVTELAFMGVAAGASLVWCLVAWPLRIHFRQMFGKGSPQVGTSQK